MKNLSGIAHYVFVFMSCCFLCFESFIGDAILLNIRIEDVVVKPKLPFWTRVSFGATST